MNFKNKMIGDKRGNVWINVMVLLIVALCLATLFSFLTSSDKVSSEVVGVNSLNEVYLDEGNFRFYVGEAGRDAIDKTYAGLKEDEIPTIDDFFKNFEEQFVKYGLDKGYLIKNNLQISGDILKLKIDNWESKKEFVTKESKIEVLYQPEFNFEFQTQN